MTSRDFCYWLQGFFELRRAGGTANHPIAPEQASVIENHLSLAFVHEIDPSQGDANHQAKLNNIHNQSSITRPPGMRC